VKEEGCGGSALAPTWETWANKLFEDNAPHRKLKKHFEWGQHHQHLTLSNDRNIVANTGCAGYGGVLAKKQANGSHQRQDPIEWRVKVLQMGVGGFAVGVGCGLKKPFKSFGNHPSAWTFHSEGNTSHNRAHAIYSTAGYGKGDVIGVILKPQTSKPKAGKSSKSPQKWDVHFEVNGKGLGRAFGGLQFGAGVPVLICQPYMQGAGQLVY
jgi:hypothetical protein